MRTEPRIEPRRMPILAPLEKPPDNRGSGVEEVVEVGTRERDEDEEGVGVGTGVIGEEDKVEVEGIAVFVGGGVGSDEAGDDRPPQVQTPSVPRGI